MEVLAERIKWLRNKIGKSQRDISDSVGLTQSGFQKIEYGQREPKLETLKLLSGLLGESTDFLLGLTDEHSHLKNIRFQMTQKMNQISMFKKMISDMSHDLILNDELIRISKERVKKENDDHNILIFKYIVEFMNTPMSNPSKDSFMRMYTPISAWYTVEKDYVAVKVNLASAVEELMIGFISHNDNKSIGKSIEAAQEKIHELRKVFTGLEFNIVEDDQAITHGDYSFYLLDEDKVIEVYNRDYFVGFFVYPDYLNDIDFIVEANELHERYFMREKG